MSYYKRRGSTDGGGYVFLTVLMVIIEAWNDGLSGAGAALFGSACLFILIMAVGVTAYYLNKLSRWLASWL